MGVEVGGEYLCMKVVVGGGGTGVVLYRGGDLGSGSKPQARLDYMSPRLISSNHGSMPVSSASRNP